MKRALEFVKKFDLAIDCGAHRGIVAKYLAKRFTTVIAIEPSVYASCIDIDNVEVIQKAVGNVNGRVGMDHGRRNTGQRHVIEGRAYEVITLDSLNLAPDFIKLDVEGYEYFAVEGAEKTIRTHKPVIIFEENGLNRRYNVPDNQTAYLLESWGMKRYATWKTIPGEKDREYVYGW
jgi:FkbM family methyltransferase